MPDCRDHGNFRVVDRAGNTLVVERPQILDRPAAAPGDKHVRELPAVGVADGADDLGRCLNALHPHRQQQHLRDGIAPPQDADHVVYRRAGPARDDGDALRIGGQRALVRGIEQPLAAELLLELLEGDIEVADAVGGKTRAVKLIRTVARIDADAAGDDDLHAVFRAEAELRRSAAEHHAAHRTLAVLEREIVVPRGIDLVV